MSSGHPQFAKKNLEIVKKAGNPTYPGNMVEKKSDVEVKNTVMPSTGTLKIALRIKSNQTVDLFEMKSKATGAALVLTPVAASDPRLADIAATLPPASDEKWVMYTTPYTTSVGKKFDTTLRLNPNAATANGFQIVTTAATFDGINFSNGHYVFGLSLLAGKNNASEPYALGTGVATAKKTAPKKAPKKAAKSKGKKKK